MIEAIGWLALALNLWGNLALARKSTRGWIIRLACNVTWIIYSSVFEVWPLLVNHILFSGVNVYGFIQWRKPEKR